MGGGEGDSLTNTYRRLRRNLDEAGYRNCLPLEALPLVQHLFRDLTKTTQSLDNTIKQYAHYKQIAQELEGGVKPFKEENVRLIKENSHLRMEALRFKEESEEQLRATSRRLRELEVENSDLKLLINRFTERVKKLQIESLVKTNKIAQIQERNLEAVILMPEEPKKPKWMQKQTMELDSFVPDACPYCVRVKNCVEFGKNRDPTAADYLKITDSRIEALTLQIRSLKAGEKDMTSLVSCLKTRIENRDAEIEKLRNYVTIRPGSDNLVNGMASTTTTNADKDLDLQLKSAQMQLEMLQRRNINLEKKLKSSILQEHEDYMMGRIRMPTDKELAMEMSHLDVDAYPTHDEMTLVEKLKYLELQLSNCCKEKAELKSALEKCEKRHKDGSQTVVSTVPSLKSLEKVKSKDSKSKSGTTSKNVSLFDLMSGVKETDDDTDTEDHEQRQNDGEPPSDTGESEGEDREKEPDGSHSKDQSKTRMESKTSTQIRKSHSKDSKTDRFASKKQSQILHNAIIGKPSFGKRVEFEKNVTPRPSSQSSLRKSDSRRSAQNSETESKGKVNSSRSVELKPSQKSKSGTADNLSTKESDVKVTLDRKATFSKMTDESKYNLGDKGSASGSNKPLSKAGSKESNKSQHTEEGQDDSAGGGNESDKDVDELPLDIHTDDRKSRSSDKSKSKRSSSKEKILRRDDSQSEGGTSGDEIPVKRSGKEDKTKKKVADSKYSKSRKPIVSEKPSRKGLEKEDSNRREFPSSSSKVKSSREFASAEKFAEEDDEDEIYARQHEQFLLDEKESLKVEFQDKRSEKRLEKKRSQELKQGLPAFSSKSKTSIQVEGGQFSDDDQSERSEKSKTKNEKSRSKESKSKLNQDRQTKTKIESDDSSSESEESSSSDLEQYERTKKTKYPSSKGQGKSTKAKRNGNKDDNSRTKSRKDKKGKLEKRKSKDSNPEDDNDNENNGLTAQTLESDNGRSDTDNTEDYYHSEREKEVIRVGERDRSSAEKMSKSEPRPSKSKDKAKSVSKDETSEKNRKKELRKSESQDSLRRKTKDPSSKVVPESTSGKSRKELKKSESVDSRRKEPSSKVVAQNEEVSEYSDVEDISKSRGKSPIKRTPQDERQSKRDDKKTKTSSTKEPSAKGASSHETPTKSKSSSSRGKIKPGDEFEDSAEKRRSKLQSSRSIGSVSSSKGPKLPHIAEGEDSDAAAVSSGNETDADELVTFAQKGGVDQPSSKSKENKRVTSLEDSRRQKGLKKGLSFSQVNVPPQYEEEYLIDNPSDREEEDDTIGREFDRKFDSFTKMAQGIYKERNERRRMNVVEAAARPQMQRTTTTTTEEQSQRDFEASRKNPVTPSETDVLRKYGVDSEFNIVNPLQAQSDRNINIDSEWLQKKVEQLTQEMSRKNRDCEIHMMEITNLQHQLSLAKSSQSDWPGGSGRFREATGSALALKDKEREIEILRRQIEALRSDFNQIGKERDDAVRDCRRLTGTMSKEELERKRLASAYEQKSREADELKKQIQRFIEETPLSSVTEGYYSKSLAQKSQLLSQKDNLELSQRLRVQAAREQELERKLSLLRSAVGTLDKDKDEMRVELDRKDEKLANMTEDCGKHLMEISNLQLALKNAELQIGHTGEASRDSEREVQVLRRQIESLRRDLEQTAREREEAVRDCRRLAGAVSKEEIERRSLSSEYDKKSKEAEGLKKQVQKYIEEVRRIEDLLLQKEEEMETLIEHYRNLSLERNSLETQRTSLEVEASSIREDVRETVDMNITLKNQLASQNALLENYELEIQRLSQTVSTLENQLASSSQMEKTAEMDVKAARDLIFTLETKMDRLKLDLANSESVKSKLEAETEEQKSHIGILEEQLQHEIDKQRQLQDLIANARDQEFQVERSTQDLSAERNQLAERLRSMQTRAENLNEEVIKFRMKSTELQTELERTKRQLQSEKSERETAIAELRRVQEQLNNSSTNTLLNAAFAASSPASGQISDLSARLGGETSLQGQQQQSSSLPFSPMSDAYIDPDSPLGASTSRGDRDRGGNN